jgi:multidrug efflux pump subunit AcrB
LWETARYEIKPRFLRIPGVARVDIVGGRTQRFRMSFKKSPLGAVFTGR